MSMEVQARYMGGNETKGYMVNVRTAHPTGKIGDAGVIRYFESDKAAKAYTTLVNETGQDIYVKPKTNNQAPVRHAGDDFVKNTTEEEVECPKISWGRAAFSILTDEQIKAINKTRKLPKGTVIIKNDMGEYLLSNSYNGFVTGTRVLPEGYEMKKDCLGATIIVPIGTEGIFIDDVA